MREFWTHLRDLRDAPHAVAGGVAIGIFWGFTPFTGLKMLLSIVTAWGARCSKLSAMLAVALHDVLLVIWPLVLRWEYQIGYWLISRPHRMPPKLAVGDARFSELFHWKTLQLLWPTFLGSCVIGIPIALATYWIVKWMLQRYERTHHRHLTPPA